MQGACRLPCVVCGSCTAALRLIDAAAHNWPAPPAAAVACGPHHPAALLACLPLWLPRRSLQVVVKGANLDPAAVKEGVAKSGKVRQYS